jgi:hypothetical protein
MTCPKGIGIFLTLLAASAAAQDAGSASAASVADPARDLQMRLSAAHARHTTTGEEDRTAFQAVEYLLLFNPNATSLVRLTSQRFVHGNQRADVDVYLAPNDDVMGVVVAVANPSNAPINALAVIPDPKERANPIVRPLYPARVPRSNVQLFSVALDAKMIALDTRPVLFKLHQGRQWDFEFVLTPDNLRSPRVASAEGARRDLPRTPVVPPANRRDAGERPDPRR